MVTDIPAPDQPPPPPDLNILLNLAKSPWQKKFSKITKTAITKKINKEARNHENWLAREWKPLIQQFARDLNLSDKQTAPLRQVFKELKLDNPYKLKSLGGLTSQKKLTDNDGVIKGSPKGIIGRDNIWSFWQQYFTPFLDGNVSDFEKMLEQLAQNEQFVSDVEDAFNVHLPAFVDLQEREHDKKVIERWSGKPPVKPSLPKPAKTGAVSRRAKRKYTQKIKVWERKRKRWQLRVGRGLSIISAGVGNPPTMSIDDESPPISPAKLKRGRRKRLRKFQAQGNVIAVNLGGKKTPANLYMSQIAPVVNDYLRPLFIVLYHIEEIESIYWSLLNIAYFLVAYALIPVSSLWKNWHGTDCVEKLIPQQAKTTKAAKKFISAPDFLLLFLPKSEQEKKPKLKKVLLAYQKFLLRFLTKEEQQRLEFLRFIGRYSGGRVLLPGSEQGFSGDGVWKLEVNTTNDAGSPVKRILQTKEMLHYDKNPQKYPERNYILPNIWPQLRTAVALCNQSGANFWFNDVDNRWGGRNWPHGDHRLGASIDFDAGFDGIKVANIKPRNKDGTPKKNKKGEIIPYEEPDCLIGIDRLMTWIGLQAFLLVGVTGYIYGDKVLMLEASTHLWAYFKVPKPATLDGMYEPKGHHNHIHYEVAVSQELTKKGHFAWLAEDTPDLFSKLYFLAAEREKDPLFWLQMVGLNKVPEGRDSFDQLLKKGVDNKEVNRWKQWWDKRESKAGIPLLPVWAPAFAYITREYDSCGPFEFDPLRFE